MMFDFPENDYRTYLQHSAKGSHWKNHKYVRVENGRYIYPEDLARSTTGRYGKGNIDLFERPVYLNEDGSVSTVESFSVNIDGEEVLLPTVSRDANGNAIKISEDEAIDKYFQDGKYLGKFKTPEQATAYAEKLHEDQERIYSHTSPNSGSSASGKSGTYAVVSGGKHYKTDDIRSALNKSFSSNVIYAPKKKR